MKLGFMQPYFFPYLGYLSLISRSDLFVIFDTAQYITHGWINRNRILHPNAGWQYIVVPLKKHSARAAINKIEISDVSDTNSWKARILGQLSHYKRRRAPYYEIVHSLLKESLNKAEVQISRLDVLTLQSVCDYIGVTFNYSYFSEMNLNLEPINHPQDWALRLSEKLCATEYLNAPGGAGFFDRNRFSEAGIKLTFLRNKLQPYNQRQELFEPGLSIVDVMMFNDKDRIREMIEDVEEIM